MRTLALCPLLVLIGTLSLCLFFAFQYPLQTTFPVGGDAPHYIKLAQSTLQAYHLSPSAVLLSFSKSIYPLSHAIFLLSSFLPVSWPERFTLWMSLGHIASALGLGLFLFRLSGWRSAATAIAAWSLTTTVINTHFEDATFAQLWSLVFIFLFFERLTAQSSLGTITFFFLTWASHPFSGIILLTSIISASPFLFLLRKKTSAKNRRLITTFFILALISILFLFFVLQDKQDAIKHLISSSNGLLLTNLIRSPFGPFLIISPLGTFFLLKKKWSRYAPVIFVFFAFALISIFISFSHYLNLGMLNHRFQTYFISSIVIMASLALPELTKITFKSAFSSALFLIILFALLSTMSWKNNDSIFHRYESPSLYQRIHPQELEAITWMKKNLPPQSTIITSASSRHPEWIPVLTPLNWLSISSSDNHFNSIYENYSYYRYERLNPSSQSKSYFAFFTFVDQVHETALKYPELFPVVYKNDAVTIVKSP